MKDTWSLYATGQVDLDGHTDLAIGGVKPAEITLLSGTGL